MSTKIYNGFKLPDATKLPDFIRAYHSWAIKHLVAYIKERGKNCNVGECAKRLGIADAPWWKKRKNKSENRVVIGSAIIMFHAMKDHRNDDVAFNLDTSLNIWLLNGSAYIIAYHPRSLPKMNRLIAKFGGYDFSYWNNSDYPKCISAKEWAERGKEWDEVCLDDWNSTRLSHEVTDGTIPSPVGFDELSKMIVRDECCDLLNPYMLAYATFYKDKHEKESGKKA